MTKKIYADINRPMPNLQGIREELEAEAAREAQEHPLKVVSDPDVMGGVPCMAGSRLPVTTLLACVNAGNEWERIVDSWPWLTPAHVAAAKAWASAQAEFLARGEHAWQQYQRTGESRPAGEAFDQVQERIDARRQQLTTAHKPEE
jgi:uncharacterized protein (DUF433 family)